jgi:hypothetical protein
MTLEKTLDKLHSAVTANKWLQIFTAFVRVLLAVGFIPPSVKKILGQPFTVLPDSTPVGHYFNALYQTGFYYEFLGWGQLVAALLLLVPRTAHLGALAFFPIILNIAVLTSSVGFAGTNYITALMLAAAAYLVAWDYDRLKAVLFSKRTEKSHFFKLEFLWLPAIFALGGFALASLLAFFRIGNLQHRFLPVALTATVAGFVFGLICAAHHRFMKTGQLNCRNRLRQRAV